MNYSAGPEEEPRGGLGIREQIQKCLIRISVEPPSGKYAHSSNPHVDINI